ncbi:hypothetical protein HPB50_018802 [Hyalomma asiaticum]|uniref:Uncharacterized protein n=1 Tax=Hyalomma asiaticum TaxID=266040 RepID=A0ACB7RN10_HYAAI|nr:hypothetical protein HPB50_018802 [Hyalomma asiaticum]
MSIRLQIHQQIESFVQQMRDIGGPSDVRELDLTNCFLPEPDQLFFHIQQCTLLRSLRCINCALRPGDILVLIAQELPCLVEVEFSLASETVIDTALLMGTREQEWRSVDLRRELRRMYVDVCYNPCFETLRKLLRFFPNLKDLHVHLSHGSFPTAVLQCTAILVELASLETFTFTSDLLPPYLRQLVRPLRFMSCAFVCANVIYRKWSDNCNCVCLSDLASDPSGPRVLPYDVILAAVDVENEVLTAEWIRAAALRNNWWRVGHLCLLLLPADHLSVVYPKATAAYCQCLRYFFEEALCTVTELNISHFHFGPDLDLKDVLQLGSLGRLQSLSVSPCGLRRLSALHLVAQCCPDFKELDVRFERRGHFEHCAGCEGEVQFGPGDMSETHSADRAGFKNRLCRLTLSDVSNAVCRRFIESCGPTTTVRLFNSPDPLTCLGETLADNSTPRCLVLQHEHLQFHDSSIMAALSRMISLEYLYLLSAVSLPDDVAERSVLDLSKLPGLLFLHVHYRGLQCDYSKYEKITWMRKVDAPVGCGTLVRKGPCFPCCTPATFIGLSKPQNRDF